MKKVKLTHNMFNTYASYKWLRAQKVRVIKKYQLKIRREIKNNEHTHYDIDQHVAMIEAILDAKIKGTPIDNSWTKVETPDYLTRWKEIGDKLRGTC